MTAAKAYRTLVDRRPTPPPLVLTAPVLGDHVDRIASGVRLPGRETVHRRAENGRPACRTGEDVPLHHLVRTAAPIDCGDVWCGPPPTGDA